MSGDNPINRLAVTVDLWLQQRTPLADAGRSPQADQVSPDPRLDPPGRRGAREGGSRRRAPQQQEGGCEAHEVRTW
jgi:hypothetical protein